MRPSGLATLVLVAQVCYSFAQVFLEQTSPEGSLCLGDDVTFTCAVDNQHQLAWRYTVNMEIESEFFFYNDPINGQVKNLGPLELVLVSTEYEEGSTVGNITSMARTTSGLTSDENGAVISCVGSHPPSITIFFAVPNITDVTYCMSTISWNHSLCDASCAVSVDGQVVETVPCRNEILSTSVSNLGSKMVVIVATDGVNQNTSTDVITEDCSGFEGTFTTMTESPSAGDSIQAGVIVGIVLVILLVAGVVVGLAIGILMYLWCQHSKKEGTEANQQLVLQQGMDHNQKDRDDDYKILTVDVQETFKDRHQHPITHCAISPDTRYAATADSNMVVRFWKTKTVYPQVNEKGTLEDFMKKVECRKWENKEKAPEIPEDRQLLLSLNWIPHHKHAKIVLTYDSCVIICNLSKVDAVVLYELDKKTSHPSMLCTACSPDGTFALSFTSEISDDPLLGHLVIGNYNEFNEKKPKTLREREACVLCMSFSPTGRKLIAGNINGDILVYKNVSERSDLASMYFQWKAHKGRVYDVQFGSTDEKKVYSLGEDGMFCLWDSSTTGTPLRKTELESYQHPPRLMWDQDYLGIATVNFVHPAIGRSKLFGFCFAYKYTLISSMERMSLYKVDADFTLSEVKNELSEGYSDISCLDCVTAKGEEYATCVMGSPDNSVHIVKLRYLIDEKQTEPEADDGKPRTAATNSMFEEMKKDQPNKRYKSRTLEAQQDRQFLETPPLTTML